MQVCILTNNGEPQRVTWTHADDLVRQGKASFISKTRYKALKSGVTVPESIFSQGDRSVKKFISENI